MCFYLLYKFLISNFRRVLNLLCILLDVSLASDCCMPTFRNPLSVRSSRAGCKVWEVSGGRSIYIPGLRLAGADRTHSEPPTTWRPSPHWFCQLQLTSALVYKYYVLRSLLILYIQPLKMEPIEGSETSAYNNQTPGKHPKEYIIEIKQGESLKSSVLSRLTQPSCPMKHFIELVVSVILKWRHCFISVVTFEWASESRNQTPTSVIKQDTREWIVK